VKSSQNAFHRGFQVPEICVELEADLGIFPLLS
jgi:hypothetical protein